MPRSKSVVQSSPPATSGKSWQQDSELQQMLLSLTMDIARVKAKSDLMTLMKARFSTLFPFTHCVISVPSRDNRSYRAYLLDTASVIRGHDQYDELVAHEWPVTEEWIITAIGTGEPFICKLREMKARGELSGNMQIIHEAGIEETMNCGLISENEVIGVLSFFSKTLGNFSEAIFPLVKVIASYISLAVVNIMAREEIEQKIREREALLTLSDAISRVKDRTGLLDVINTKLKQLFRFNYSLVVRLSDDGMSCTAFLLDPQSTSRSDPDYNKITSRWHTINDGIVDRVLNADGPVMIDIEKEALRSDAPEYTIMQFRAGVRECVGVTLRDGNRQPLGLILFCAEQKGWFNTDVLNLIRAVSYHLATAMSNIFHHEYIQARDAENELLLTISHAIASIPDRTKLIHRIKRALQTRLQFSDIAIVQYNINKGIYKVILEDCEKTNQHKDFESIAFREHPLQDGLHNVVMASEGTVILSVPALQKSGGVHFDFLAAAGIVEIAGIRLMHNNEVFGGMTLLSEKSNTFSAADMRLIERFSYHLSGSVANMLANEAIQQREKEKEILLALSADIARTSGPESLIAVMRQRLKSIFRFNDITVGLFNAEKTAFKVMVADVEERRTTHPAFNEIAFSEYPIADGIHDVLLHSDKPELFYIENLLMKNPGKHPGIQFIFERGIREIAGVKLVNQNEDIGFITMLSEERNSFRPKDLHLLKGVSDQVAVAVANILADEKIEQQLKEINGYKEKLEEEKLYLQQEISSVYTYTDIIGAGPEMQRVFHMLSQVSFAQSTVLILGETGTGKELIARAIHNASPRKSKLMVKVNCAALPANLIESELFGHERGSFTGAVERRIGKFELANHGTLFLDEIGEMPLDLQVKLLRAIQEKEIERIGGKSTIKTDVRIIAATNRNLQKEVAEGRFRSDLFYRLNVFPIVLPPLRDRKEDISLLAAHFMERFARSAGRKNVRLSSTAMKQLTAYNWPGNVRELEHVLERSILLTQGNVIREINLSSQPKSDHKVQPEEDYTRTFEEMERDYILGVLNKCKGKVFGPGGAAEILGMHVSTLNHRIKKLGIRKEQTYYIRKP
ncbi:sigma 54-interacting transcriptional regulator [Chitinophaga rhizophila]|nr:sigma 54-interacting transcriptional regulator [Chitinophaga rhizophila]